MQLQEPAGPYGAMSSHASFTQGFARVRQCLASTEVETKHAGCALQHGRGCSVVDVV